MTDGAVDYEDDDFTCQECNDGVVTDCCDDLCQGDECIHGDYRACPACGGTGLLPRPGGGE